MIIITTFLILMLYNKVTQNPNVINLFNEKNSLLALLIFSIEGFGYLLISYLRRNTKCNNLRDFLIFVGLYNILLGISLFLMRITNFLVYLLIFYMIMSIVIVTIIIVSLTKPNLINQLFKTI
jgi:hypothetical protein